MSNPTALRLSIRNSRLQNTSWEEMGRREGRVDNVGRSRENFLRVDAYRSEAVCVSSWPLMEVSS